MATAIFAAYLAAGATGLPVFSGSPERGLGLAYIAGPTGGYLIGYLIASGITGWLAAGRGLLGQVINMKDQYGRWSEQANDNVAASLRGFGLMRDQMAGDRAVVDVIRARSSGAEGMKQALQANVEMGGAMVNELHRLREIALEDARQHANALAIEAERRATEEA